VTVVEQVGGVPAHRPRLCRAATRTGPAGAAGRTRAGRRRPGESPSPTTAASTPRWPPEVGPTWSAAASPPAPSPPRAAMTSAVAPACL